MTLRASTALSLVATLGLSGCGESFEPTGPDDSHDAQTSLMPPEPAIIPLVWPGRSYRRSDLPFRPSAINDHGVIVGTVREDGRTQAVVWREGTLYKLTGLSDGDTQAADINNSGVIVGSSVDTLGRSRAIRWVGGAPEDLGTLGGAESAALGINEPGQIVGMSETEGELSGFLWVGGRITALPPTPPNSFGYAEDINEDGVAVGWSAGARLQDATVWIDGVPSALPSLAYEASASAIGDDGVIVGASIPDYQNSARGVRWEDGRVEDLPTPPGVVFSSARDINALGQTVGDADGLTIWEGDGYTRIDSLGYGAAINDRGQAVGWWFSGAAFLWELRRTFPARPAVDPVEPPPAPVELTHRPLRTSASALCRVPRLLSRKAESALRVAGCVR